MTTLLAPPNVVRAPALDLLPPIHSLLRELHEKYLPLQDGKLADYIPELTKVDPNLFSIAIVTTDGHLFEVGDAAAQFTMQSISKPLVYGMALEDRGRDFILSRIGVEPSGDPFNSIQFDERNNRPFNAMVNAGAIGATSFIHGGGVGQRMSRILASFGTFVGRDLVCDEAVYQSESRTGWRNRAIAYLELGNGMIEGDVEEHLELYFRQCSILVTSADLAYVGATLANGGVHPVTGKRALTGEHVRDVLSVMTTCGMYDYAGEWELRVGLPAKSGVGGGIMAVLPGQLAIGIFSPLLDEHGNSLRGVRVCEDLSKRLKLHLLDHRGSVGSALRGSYRGAEMRSRRQRSIAAQEQLDSIGKAIRVFEMQGDLFFANTERVVRTVLTDTGAKHVVFDMKRVISADSVAIFLLRDVAETLRASGRSVTFAAASPSLRPMLSPNGEGLAYDIYAALERCEDALLADRPAWNGVAAKTPTLEDFDLVKDLTAHERKSLAVCVVPVRYRRNETIIRQGDLADCLYFLTEGSVDVRISTENDGTATHLSTIDAGNAFGELALLGQQHRSANVVAATDVSVLRLEASRFDDLCASEPRIREKLLIAVGRSLSDRLRRANMAIGALTG